jgi:ER lumen protein retaining receptor
MNIFRLAGDMMHVVSIVLLILRLTASKNAVGISIKTQQLYLLVFVTRYLDLLTSFYSLYNSIMKVLYISATAYVIFMVYKTEPFRTEYDRSQDSFLHWQFAVAPCAVLALVTVLIQGFDFMEVRVCVSV